MGLVPDKRTDRMQFFENRIPLWTSNATSIGSSSADVTSLGTLTSTARTAYAAQQVALDAAKSATAAFYDAVEKMGAKGASIIKQIRTHADVTNNPAVYQMANIPAPATPTTRGNPGMPFKFTATLNPNGSVDLAWKCSNPAGTSTIYQVYRSLTGMPNTFTYLGGTGERKITDSTIPLGTTRVTYQIQGVRTNAVGIAADFSVTFGSAGAQQVTDATMKLAA